MGIQQCVSVFSIIIGICRDKISQDTERLFLALVTSLIFLVNYNAANMIHIIGYIEYIEHMMHYIET